MKKINIFFSLMIIFFCLIFFSDKRNEDLVLELENVGDLLEIEFIKDGELYLKNKNLVIKKIDVELSYRDTEKKNGLTYRSFLKENRGMLFLFQDREDYKIINMKNMRIPLDIIYINQFNTVLSIKTHMNPMIEIDIPKTDEKNIIKYVLAINAGMSKKWGIKEGITKITWFFNGKNGN
ncbi:DUF192 domain-containing protein [Blattabacterium cuenoti]|uniref:DUF192 domain-containing protein n=1 Tax=Blattabacterium cuenoti TaxID=1653831 RepID=UPI00163D21B7|nr:DUF192 domain-containing protein [Blattabacterium cuenoti]